MIISVDFRERLKDEMVYKDIQHKELASRANVKPRALLSYVSSHPSMPPADVAVRLAEVLGVSVEYLVTGNKTKMTADLPRTERELLAAFSKLSEKEQKAVLSLAQNLACT